MGSADARGPGSGARAADLRGRFTAGRRRWMCGAGAAEARFRRGGERRRQTGGVPVIPGALFLLMQYHSEHPIILAVSISYTVCYTNNLSVCVCARARGQFMQT